MVCNISSHQVCKRVLELLKIHKLDSKVCDVPNVCTMLGDMCHTFLTLLLLAVLAVLAVWLVVVYLLILHVVAQVHKMTQIIDGLFVGNKVSSIPEIAFCSIKASKNPNIANISAPRHVVKNTAPPPARLRAFCLCVHIHVHRHENGRRF